MGVMLDIHGNNQKKIMTKNKQWNKIVTLEKSWQEYCDKVRLLYGPDSEAIISEESADYNMMYQSEVKKYEDAYGPLPLS